MLIFSLSFDQFDPFSQVTQKVWTKSAIRTEKKSKTTLSKLINSEPGGGPEV